MDEKTTEMLEWVIISALACVSSLFLIDILNTKKTEIKGAHAVVRFETVSANFDGKTGNENEQIAKVEFIVVIVLSSVCFRLLVGQVELERL